MKWIIGIIFIIIWSYILSVMKRAELNSWRFFWGSFGLFILIIAYIRPYVTELLANIVAALAGLFGGITHTFTPYFKYGTIFIETMQGSMTMQIDFECSGVLEIAAFLSLLLFFDVYNKKEKFVVSLMGAGAIIVSNALRIILICEIIHFGGEGLYFLAHTFIGRIFFYVLSVLLYFFVFTKPHIVKMRVGSFSYDHN